MSNLTLYGIPNCDTVKRARQALDAAGVDHRFHDFRKDGLNAEQVARWADAVGLDTLINRRGMTWRPRRHRGAARGHQTAGVRHRGFGVGGLCQRRRRRRD